MDQLKGALRILDVKFEAKPISKDFLPEYLKANWKDHNSYQCFIEYQDKGLVCFFFSNNTFDVEDVINCLLTDGSYVSYEVKRDDEPSYLDYSSFEDYCDMMGCDQDSKKEEKTFELMKENTEKLLDMFGFDIFSRLMEISNEE